MARLFTGEEMIASIRDRGGFNDAESEGTQDADLLNRINEESWTTLYNAVMQAHREYFVITEHIPLVTTTPRYRINHRAMLQKLRAVFYRNGTARKKLTSIARERLDAFSTTSGLTSPSGYYIEGNNIVLVPDVGGAYTGNLEVAFFFRPGELVKSTDTRKIAAGGVNAATKTITITAAAPAAWVAGTKIDIHSERSGAEIHAWDLTISSLPSSTQITFTEAIDGSTQGTMPVLAGDYVCLAEQAALPGLPRELHPVLAQAVKVSLMEVKDPEAYQVSKVELDKSIVRALKLIDERADDSAETIVNTNSVVFSGHGGYTGSFQGG